MQDPFNPYAAPTTLEPQPEPSEWLGIPNESLRKVASGLGLFRAAALLALAAFLFYIAVAVFIAFSGMGPGVRMSSRWYGAIVVIVEVMHLLAGFRCLSLPAEMRAKGWILAYVVVELFVLISSLVSLVGPWWQIASWTQQVFALWAQQLLRCGAMVTFLLFLRNLGLFIDRTDLAQRSVTLLIVWAFVFGLYVARIAVVLLPLGTNGFWAGPGLWILIALGLAYFVVGIVALVKYINLLAALKSAILTGR